jgi:glycerate-2-kinase
MHSSWFDEKRELTRAFVAAGAEIRGLNAVRKHLSAVKGGGLARAAAHAAAVWTLVLSDVVGDDLATIASGPTEADPTTYADALAMIGRHGISMPPSIRRHLGDGAAGAIAETAKPGDPATTRVRSVLVGRNADAVSAAGAEAMRRGYHATEWPAALVGDAAVAGRALAHAIAAATSAEAIVAGGETTVRALPGGMGGRSQHLGLAAALELGGAGARAVLLAAGTDGVDGPTDAAGACVDGGTIERARQRGLDPEAALAATDSHRLLAATGDLIRTGPTGTNVADVVVALARPA